MTADDKPSSTINPLRSALALVALIGGLIGMTGLYFVPIPEGNREPLLLALGLVLGWGSTVIGHEFGSSPAGRRAADAGIRPPLQGGAEAPK
jgi:fatty acid desaturase